MRCYQTGCYKPAERAGVSYMLSPLPRTYVNPDQRSEVETSNNPHVMDYAPNVTNREFGGVKPDVHPLPFIIQAAPHGFIVQHLGKEEAAEITRGYAPMLKRLCGLNRCGACPRPQAGVRCNGGGDA